MATVSETMNCAHVKGMHFSINMAVNDVVQVHVLNLFIWKIHQEVKSDMLKKYLYIYLQYSQPLKKEFVHSVAF